ncbi:MAG: DEAD/DEAH box helicase [Desulfobacteraceae bacterium]|nr:DEAD/DEAH box helicase [Desulfobacteraceae bacterium]
MKTFNELELNQEILKSIDELGFIYPTPIQQKVIPSILNSESDIIALAQTGTGKTAAFGLPLIQQSDFNSNKVQLLVLCPTRELCIQITGDIIKYSKYLKNLKTVAVYGGANIDSQRKALREGAQIVIGTPGRLNDLIRRKSLKIENLKCLVLDEADEMLNMGFKEELDSILINTPIKKRTLLFSATMPKEVVKIAENYMNKPEEIFVGNKNESTENVKHEYFMVNAKDRYEALKRIADINPNIYGIVFCRTRRETKEVADKLMDDGYNADALHGDLTQVQRDHVMNRFRMKYLQLLVATDVAARGLDVHNLSHIINYNLPDEPQAYIHRSGRTGRAGKSGISISIIHTRETRRIENLERITGKKFVRKMVPKGTEICEKRLYNLIDKVEKIEVDNAQIEQFLPTIYKKLDWLSREELIKHFVSVEFNRFLAYYKNAPDLNVKTQHKDRERSQKSGRRAQGNFSRFYINVGTNHGLKAAPLLIGLINDVTKNRSIEIGKIDIMKKFSFFEVDKNYETQILKSFVRGTKFGGANVLVELSKPEPQKQVKERHKKDYKERYKKDNRKPEKKHKGKKRY